MVKAGISSWDVDSKSTDSPNICVTRPRGGSDRNKPNGTAAPAPRNSNPQVMPLITPDTNSPPITTPGSLTNDTPEGLRGVPTGTGTGIGRTTKTSAAQSMDLVMTAAPPESKHQHQHQSPVKETTLSHPASSYLTPQMKPSKPLKSSNSFETLTGLQSQSSSGSNTQTRNTPIPPSPLQCETSPKPSPSRERVKIRFSFDEAGQWIVSTSEQHRALVSGAQLITISGDSTVLCHELRSKYGLRTTTGTGMAVSPVPGSVADSKTKSEEMDEYEYDVPGMASVPFQSVGHVYDLVKAGKGLDAVVRISARAMSPSDPLILTNLLQSTDYKLFKTIFVFELPRFGEPVSPHASKAMATESWDQFLRHIRLKYPLLKTIDPSLQFVMRLSSVYYDPASSAATSTPTCTPSVSAAASAPAPVPATATASATATATPDDGKSILTPVISLMTAAPIAVSTPVDKPT